MLFYLVALLFKDISIGNIHKQSESKVIQTPGYQPLTELRMKMHNWTEKNTVYNTSKTYFGIKATSVPS